MSRCACPGSFDPFTAGHLDVVERAAALYDEVTVLVLVHSGKTGLFTAAERVELVRACTAALPGVRVASWPGLLVDWCRANDVPVVVKGLRGAGDVDLELAMAQMNRRVGGVETLLLPTDPALAFVSSSLVKQVAAGGGDVHGLVPEPVRGALAARLAGAGDAGRPAG